MRFLAGHHVDATPLQANTNTWCKRQLVRTERNSPAARAELCSSGRCCLTSFLFVLKVSVDTDAFFFSVRRVLEQWEQLFACFLFNDHWFGKMLTQHSSDVMNHVVLYFQRRNRCFILRIRLFCWISCQETRFFHNLNGGARPSAFVEQPIGTLSLWNDLWLVSLPSVAEFS